ncbi:MAG: chemotaxis protein CheB [Bacteroidia bacterium]|nr:MAG: chemotaxis protein CheB [Bacteroidia bacterium]
MTERPFLWVVAGSAGSFTPARQFVQEMPYRPQVAIVLCLHRMRKPRVPMIEAFSRIPYWQVVEPQDKDPIESGKVYLAPADYHLLVEREGYFSLSVDEPVHFSRPSIDVLLESVVEARWPRAGAVLLSGANRDGAWGLYLFHRAGYFTAVQDPQEAEVPTMPRAALELFTPNRLCKAHELVQVCLEALSL